MANSFKQLAEEAEEQFPQAPAEVEHKLMGSVRVTQLVGNVVELYLPRMLDVLRSLFSPIDAPPIRDIKLPLEGDTDPTNHRSGPHDAERDEAQA